MKTKGRTAEHAEQMDKGIHRDDRFLKSIFRHFLPATMLSVLGATINTLVDSAIVGNMMGERALAAINLCGPISLMCCAAGAFIGSGGSFLAASCVGQNDEEGSCKCYTLSVVLELVLGLLIASGSMFISPIVGLLGANERVYQFTMEYARILLWSAPFKCLIYVPFNFLRLDGKPGASSVALITMTAVNGVLDVLLIKLGFGMAGVSAASAIGSAVGVAIGFLYQRGGSFRLVSLNGAGSKIKKMMELGTPAALNNLLSMARMMLLNRLLMKLGGSAWVAAFTVAGSISDFALCVLNGVPQTAAPLIGVYCAEKNNVVLRRLMNMQFRYGETFITIFTLLTSVFSSQLCGLFGLEASAQAVLAMRMLALSLPPAMLCTIMFYFYNASGHVLLSNIITIFRSLFAVMPAFAFGYFGLPVWLFFPASELMTLAALLPVLWLFHRKNANLSHVMLLDEILEREGKVIDFSVENSLPAVTRAAERISSFCSNNNLNPKQAMAVSLSIEEMLIILLEHCFHPGENVTADVRVFAVQGEVGVRIRNAGEQFNPLAYYEEHKDTDMLGDTLGIVLIQNMAKTVKYQRTFGVNTLTIWI